MNELKVRVTCISSADEFRAELRVEPVTIIDKISDGVSTNVRTQFLH